ncbi:hypothetical protein AB8302_004702 [Vibrio parahaemolyticus]|uniref:hypothetical protein n=1 Tax=Vibrio vulnificus TaxID=672 RepID=UPI001DF49E23|nr:hypothetical protein [Vibrio parahaemolyticus]HDY7978896.1 hypothetical protein [Vibrio vulnificus]EGR2205919.1 hypothetical protein [Vibrio parahaemolyticus]EGX7690503.1 hypothetical protein [Vibrio parahaemolyticus]EHH1251701.1 hypothetical protein [Vibrio parahaemolyticus]
MSCAIKISNSSNCSFINVGISGFDVGIDAENSDGLSLKQVDFGNCNTGLRGRQLKGLNAQGCTHGGTLSFSAASCQNGNNVCFHYALLYLRVFGYNPYK